VTIDALRAAGAVQRVAVLDMDLHYGNGTASLAPARQYLFNLSIYGNDYFQNQAFRDVSVLRHTDGPNHRSIALPNGSGRAEMFAAMDAGLPQMLTWGRPDLLLYQAGADPYCEDPYSPLALDHDDLMARDRRVFEFARAERIPIAWVLAGGYTPDTSKVVRVHLNTFEAALAVFD
jgi:acetoin utilization deacetylase AcuC-like enzyme